MTSNTTPTSPVVDLRALRPDTDQGPDLFDLLAEATRAEETASAAASTTPGKPTAAGRPALTPGEEFEAYCADNQVIYDVMVRLCKKWVTEFNGERLGVRSLVEKSRWEVRFATKDPTYKINNNWAPWYGRLIMYREPGMGGLFELRRAPAADRWIRELAMREGRLHELPALMGWADAAEQTGRAA